MSGFLSQAFSVSAEGVEPTYSLIQDSVLNLSDQVFSATSDLVNTFTAAADPSLQTVELSQDNENLTVAEPATLKLGA